MERNFFDEQRNSSVDKLSVRKSSVSQQRRKFLQYLVGTTAGTVALGFLFPRKSQSVEPTLEQLCSLFPLNSRCENYLPGVQAEDTAGAPISVQQLMATVKAGERIAVKGLPEPEVNYLVITDGPTVASYGIKPICTHLGCTVPWNAEQNRFICPCHGSQYDSQGRVIHGPAARNLPLITVLTKQDQIRLVDTAPAIDPRESSGTGNS